MGSEMCIRDRSATALNDGRYSLSVTVTLTQGRDALPASLSTVCPVLGIFPRKVLYSPAKEPLYEAKVGYFCSEKLSASGASPPDPTNRGSASAPGPHCENSPRPPSSHVHPLMSTVSGVRHRHPQFLAVWCQNIVFKGEKALASGGLLPPDPLPELCPWITMGDFRSSYPPATLAVLSGNESLSTVVFSTYSWLDDVAK